MTSLYKCYYISKTVFYLSDHIPVYSVKKGKREQEGSELSTPLTNIGTHKHYTQTDMNIHRVAVKIRLEMKTITY